MPKIIVVNICSVDGYYEGPGNNVMALPMDHAFDSYNLERIQAADTVLLGAASYRMFNGFWPAMANDPQASCTHRAFRAAEPYGTTCSRTEMVDELHLIVGDTALGGGTSLLPAAMTPRLLDTRRFDGSDNLLAVYSPGSDR
ncbi:MAG: hypothetical protein ABJA87_02505 [bacterium]